MTPPVAGRLGRRFGRILLLLPHVIKNPGVSVTELADLLGATPKEIVADLELLWMCGLPGYGPGDLIDVAIEDDKVSVSMADYFATPLRLTPVEGLALYAGAAALLEMPGMDRADSLRSALAKLAAALGGSGTGSHGVKVRLEAGPLDHVATLRTALTSGRKVRLSYLSAGKGELTDRSVAPWGLVAARSHLYLVGLDDASGEERMFRTDRMRAVELLDESSDVPADFDPNRYLGAFSGRGDSTISLEVSPDVARWFTDYYPVIGATPARGGWLAVELVSGGDHWSATLVARLGKAARRVRPARVKEAAQALARRIAERHAGPAA